MPHRQTKPEDFRERVMEMTKSGMLRTEMCKVLNITSWRFAQWFTEEFPGQSLRTLKSAYHVRTASMARPNNDPRKYDKPWTEPLTPEEREAAHQRVQEAERDYLPRLAVPVRVMTDEEFKRMS